MTKSVREDDTRLENNLDAQHLADGMQHFRYCLSLTLQLIHLRSAAARAEPCCQVVLAVVRLALAAIGADTAENEPGFSSKIEKNLTKFCQAPHSQIKVVSTRSDSTSRSWARRTFSRMEAGSIRGSIFSLCPQNTRRLHRLAGFITRSERNSEFGMHEQIDLVELCTTYTLQLLFPPVHIAEKRPFKIAIF